MVERVAAVFPGRMDDRGFMSAGRRGIAEGCARHGFALTEIERVGANTAQIAAALRDLARDRSALVFAQGGQCDEAAAEVAAQYPATRIVVIQGDVSGPNLSSYRVLQEQSAWLAGAAAARLTRTGIVGHISGVKPLPGLRGRAAFIAGARHADPALRCLTHFTGDQDDADKAHSAATRQIGAGADIIFSMLNAAQPGVLAACRGSGARLIGDARDWIPDAPELFIASAVADSAVAARRALDDFVAGEPGCRIVSIGLERSEAVRLELAPDIDSEVRAVIDTLADRILSREVQIPETYDGPEFP